MLCKSCRGAEMTFFRQYFKAHVMQHFGICGVFTWCILLTEYMKLFISSGYCAKRNYPCWSNLQCKGLNIYARQYWNSVRYFITLSSILSNCCIFVSSNSKPSFMAFFQPFWMPSLASGISKSLATLEWWSPLHCNYTPLLILQSWFFSTAIHGLGWIDLPFLIYHLLKFFSVSYLGSP